MTTQMAAASIAGHSPTAICQPDVAVESRLPPVLHPGSGRALGSRVRLRDDGARRDLDAGGYSETADRSRATVYRRQGKQMVKGTVSLDFPIYRATRSSSARLVLGRRGF